MREILLFSINTYIICIFYSVSTLIDKEINKTELHNGSGLMISTIKELFNEIFDKMQYLFIILPLFCLFIMVFSMPENISNHSLIKFLFPNNLVDSLNSELAIYIISFYGFLWIVFFCYGRLKTLFSIIVFEFNI